MLFNMSINKKSHHHLADKSVVEFLSHIFQVSLCRTKRPHHHQVVAEAEALHKTIKNVLHIFSHLIHETSIAAEILENNVLPIFVRAQHHLEPDSDHWADVSFINRKLNESLANRVVVAESYLMALEEHKPPSSLRRLVPVDESRQETFV
jgi:hypothetical protein